MALPPEQINIKRRREEEPVETLCKSATWFDCLARSDVPFPTPQFLYPVSIPLYFGTNPINSMLRFFQLMLKLKAP